jgi:hypothetical protein
MTSIDIYNTLINIPEEDLITILMNVFDSVCKRKSKLKRDKLEVYIGEITNTFYVKTRKQECLISVTCHMKKDKVGILSKVDRYGAEAVIPLVLLSEIRKYKIEDYAIINNIVA